MNFILLLYVSRSGSTMFARQLALHSADLVVLPECRLPELLVAEGQERLRQMSGESLFTLMRRDYQRDGLGLGDATLRECAARAAGGDVRDVLECVVSAYAVRQGKVPSCALLQVGSLLTARALLAVLPGTRCVHIFRDGRAVVNSLLRTVRPYFPGVTMGRGDVVFAARYWGEFLHEVSARAARGEPIYDVRYEDLCLNTERVVRATVAWIGATYGSVSGDSSGWLFRIPARERVIHQYVDRPPMRERIDGWEKELAPWQGIVVETIAGRILRMRGYAPHFLPRASARAIVSAHIRAVAIHAWKTLEYDARRLVFYVGHPAWLRYRIALLRMRT